MTEAQEKKLLRIRELISQQSEIEVELLVLIGESVEAPAWNPNIPKLKKITSKIEKLEKNEYGIVHPCCLSKRQSHKKKCPKADGKLPPVEQAKCIDCDNKIPVEEPFDWYENKCECGGKLIPV